MNDLVLFNILRASDSFRYSIGFHLSGFSEIYFGLEKLKCNYAGDKCENKMQDSSKSFLIRDLLGDLIRKTDEHEHSSRNGLCILFPSLTHILFSFFFKFLFI